jgi:hypothetical protein
MQHDLDYDRAWDKVSQQFWRRRRRELGINIALFTGAHIVAFFIKDFLGYTFTTGSPPLIILRQLGIENLAHTTFAWATILIVHLLILMAMGLGERIFRYSVERELLRDFAQLNKLDEKRKMRPSYAALSDDDEAFDVIDEAQEVSSRQSAR